VRDDGSRDGGKIHTLILGVGK